MAVKWLYRLCHQLETVTAHLQDMGGKKISNKRKKNKKKSATEAHHFIQSIAKQAMLVEDKEPPLPFL